MMSCCIGCWCLWFCNELKLQHRGRAAEVMVSGDQAYLIRERETIESLWEKERLLPEE
jgi:diaminopimelate decarboxylase